MPPTNLIPIFGNVHILIRDGKHTASETEHDIYCFDLDERVSYIGFQEDFGPMNLASIFLFCQILDEHLESCKCKKLALTSTRDCKQVTNRILLLGCYLLMNLDASVKTIQDKFRSIESCLVPYCDVSRGPQTFNLFVSDCLCGLAKAKKLGWISFKDDDFDYDEYTNFDCPLNADLHEMVPGKIVAMRGPRDLGGALWQDVIHEGVFSHREFSPEHYCEILHQFNVRVVVRLNDLQYDKQVFLDAGIAVADIFFKDCTEPPVDVVAKFLAIVEGFDGAVAVHCKAGLGRTGTLIGMYLMKHHSFTAREAIGWMRMVRPGSVIGSQQNFLCAREGTMARSRKLALGHVQGLGLAPGVEDLQAAIDETCRFYDARFSLAMKGLTSPTSVVDMNASKFGNDVQAVAAHVSLVADRRAGIRAKKLRENRDSRPSD